MLIPVVREESMWKSVDPEEGDLVVRDPAPNDTFCGFSIHQWRRAMLHVSAHLREDYLERPTHSNQTL